MLGPEEIEALVLVMRRVAQRGDARLAAVTPPGGGELTFAVDSPATVDAVHVAWRVAGRTIVQPPTAMDFGTTFTALDPDGHRFRVFAPREEG